jgi:hypothetical protein
MPPRNGLRRWENTRARNTEISSLTFKHRHSLFLFIITILRKKWKYGIHLSTHINMDYT